MNNQRKRLGVIDYFIIVALVACVVGAALRYFAVGDSIFNSKNEIGEYTLTFKVTDIRNSSAQNYFKAGTVFYLEDSDLMLGTLGENIIVNDAEKVYYLLDGTAVSVKNNLTGDQYRVDVEGEFKVKGTMSEDGSFMLDGNRYLASGSSVNVYSKYISVTLTVTGITKSN